MKQLKRNLRGSLILLLGFYTILIVYFCYTLFVYSDRWFSDPNNSRVKVDMINPSIIPGKIFDRNQVLLVETKSKTSKDGNTSYFRSYNEDSRYAAHVIGSRQAGIGAEVLYVRYLLGYNNNLFERIYQKAFMEQEQGNNVILTIDIRLQKLISNALGSRKGSIVLLNPTNGEVLAMVSQPTFDPSLEVKDIESVNLFNKAAFGKYPPGSIMKVITAAAALQSLPGIDDYTVECKGTTNIEGVIINCYNNEAHGIVGLNRAMEVSCNAFFAKLALDLGWKEFRNTGQQFGFNQDFIYPDIKTIQSDLPINRNTESEELAWSAVGQGKVLTTPLHMALVAASIANGGTMLEPKLIHSIQLRNGHIKPAASSKVLSKPLSIETAVRIQEMMINVVKNGTGKGAQSPDLKIAGKTGTAEVQSGQLPHAWFIGFAPADEPTLAISIILENAGTGGSQAAPLASSILSEAVKLGY